MESDTEQITECLQCAVTVTCKNPFGKYLAQLDAFLVKAVQIPEETLEHHFVLKVGQQCAKCFRGQLFANNDG